MSTTTIIITKEDEESCLTYRLPGSIKRIKEFISSIYPYFLKDVSFQEGKNLLIHRTSVRKGNIYLKHNDFTQRKSDDDDDVPFNSNRMPPMVALALALL